MPKFKYLVYSCYTAGLRFAETVFKRGHEVRIVSHKTNSFNDLYERTLPGKIIYFDDIQEPALYNQIHEFSPDFLVSLIFNKKIPTSHFALAKDVAVNIHPSRLPQIRTGDSILWNILLEDSTFQITMHKLTENWDAGDILMAVPVILDPLETRNSMINKVERLMATSSTQFQLPLENKTYILVPQITGSYYPKFKQKTFCLSLDEDPIFIEKLVRASGDEFSVVLYYKDQDICLIEVELTNKPSVSEPGILIIDGNDLFLNTKNTQLKIKTLFLDGLGMLNSKEFIGRYKPTNTDRLMPKNDDESKQIYDTWAKYKSS